MRALLALLGAAAVLLAALLFFGGDSPSEAVTVVGGAASSSGGAATPPAAGSPDLVPDPARATAVSSLPDVEDDAPVIGGCVVEGAVLGADGRPAVHAYVWAAVGGRSVDTESGAGGRYALELPAGAFVIRARSRDTGTMHAPVEVPAGATRIDGPTLRLDDGARIVGRVFEGDGTPLEGFRVQCTAEDGSAVQFFTDGGTPIRFGSADVLTDAEGRFVLRGLAADVPHTVLIHTILRPDLSIEPKAHTGVLPDGPPIVFAVRTGRSIEGRVIDSDTGAPVRWFEIAGRPFEDEDGQFETPLPGRGPVMFEALGYLPVVRDDLDLQEGESRRGVVVELAKKEGTGTLKVKVEDDAGRPVRAFTIRCRETDGTPWSRDVTDAAEGVGTIAGLDPGTTRLVIRAENHAEARLDATIEAGSAREESVKLTRGADVRLYVQDGEGGAFTGDVAIEDGEGRGPAWRFRPRHSRGTLLRMSEQSFRAGEHATRGHLDPAEGSVVGLPAGRYVLSVYYGHEPVRRTFEVFPETAADVVVRP